MLILSWLIAALVLALIELFVGDFSILMLAVAALFASAGAALGAPLWATVVIFGISAVLLFLLLRPYMRKRLKKTQAQGLFSDQQLIGESAQAVDQFGTLDKPIGQVDIMGNIWSAKSQEDGHIISQGDTVKVVDVDDNLAVVKKEQA